REGRAFRQAREGAADGGAALIVEDGEGGAHVGDDRGRDNEGPGQRDGPGGAGGDLTDGRLGYTAADLDRHRPGRGFREAATDRELAAWAESQLARVGEIAGGRERLAAQDAEAPLVTGQAADVGEDRVQAAQLDGGLAADGRDRRAGRGDGQRRVLRRTAED